MNKRIKKKRKDAHKLEELEKAHYELKRDHCWAMVALDASNQECCSLRLSRNAPHVCSHSIEPNYGTRDGVETHRLQVNAPLWLMHSGPLCESDVYNIATKLAEALQVEVISQLMPHISKGLPRI